MSITFVCGDCETVAAEGRVRVVSNSLITGLRCPECGGDDLWHSTACGCEECVESRRIAAIQHEQHEAGYANAKRAREQMALVKGFAALLAWFNEGTEAEMRVRHVRGRTLDAAAVLARESGKSFDDAISRWLKWERERLR